MIEDFERMTGKQAEKYVKSRAKELKLSVLGLCNKAGISHVTIWRWGQGTKPSLELLLKIARV